MTIAVFAWAKAKGLPNFIAFGTKVPFNSIHYPDLKVGAIQKKLGYNTLK
jgi:hypothetical protein